MSFGQFWHVLTTSRYTRYLERENAELRIELGELKIRLENARHRPVAIVSSDANPREQFPVATATRRQNRRWVGFSQRKRELESLEAPTKGA